MSAATGETAAYELGPLLDHHCHPLVLGELDRAGFEGLLNEAEAPSPLGTSLFDSMLGLSLRRWCAPVLDLPPNASAGNYLARRTELGAEASRRLVGSSGIDAFLVDTGIRDSRLCGPDQVAAMAEGRAYEVLRLETLIEDLLQGGTDARRIAAAVHDALHRSPAVAAKSVAAYRSGLDLAAERPTDAALQNSVETLRPTPALSSSKGECYRVVDPLISSWLAWTALEHSLPLQIHVGFGDRDLDLRRADPLRLTGFLRATERFGVPVLLLHNYPYHRSAAYLAQVYEHVFLDVGLAVHNAGALSRAVVRETLEIAPFGKLLFSSDAYGLAELYYLGALQFRRALAAVFGGLVAAEELAPDDARRIGQLMARENATRIYRL
jgi:uncharacterized protein